MPGACECGNKPSGSMKCKKFSDWQRTCLLPRKDCTTGSSDDLVCETKSVMDLFLYVYMAPYSIPNEVTNSCALMYAFYIIRSHRIVIYRIP